MSTNLISNTKFDLKTLVTQALQRSSEVTATGQSFIDDLSLPKFAMGRNEDTLNVHHFKPLNGVIDDYYPEYLWQGIPIIKSHLIPKESMLLNTSTSISPLNVQLALNQLSNHKVVGLNQVIQASNGKIKWPHFVDAQRKEISENLSSLQNIHDLLADDESKKTLRDILCFRLTADISYLSDYSVRIEQQYFEAFMNFNEELFIDAGGFNGDTTKSFVKLYPNYRKVIFFEPSQLNMTVAKSRLAGFQNIEFHSLGLSDISGTLGFDSKSGSASSIQQHGVEKIIVDTLDHVVSEPVTFIKMDLEGWELNALLGSHRHIKLDRPKLAIAVYHHAADLRLIYEYINSFDHEYKVYLRHYTQGWSETVMYFL